MTMLARQQIRDARAFGASVSGYVWAYWGVDALEHINSALDVAPPGSNLKMIWIDCEDDAGAAPGTVGPWLVTAREIIEARGYRMGIYTGRYWWQDKTGNSEVFADLPLWLADYDNVDTLEMRYPFGGWTTLAGKQYTSDPIDLDVFSSTVI